MASSFVSLRAKWTQFRTQCERFGTHVEGCKVADEVLADLDALETSADNETVTLTEAAQLSGYHPDSLGRMVREGTLTNMGSPHRPRLLRSELPRKAVAPSRQKQQNVRLVTPGNADAVAAIARDAVASRSGRTKSA